MLAPVNVVEPSLGRRAASSASRADGERRPRPASLGRPPRGHGGPCARARRRHGAQPQQGSDVERSLTGRRRTERTEGERSHCGRASAATGKRAQRCRRTSATAGRRARRRGRASAAVSASEHDGWPVSEGTHSPIRGDIPSCAHLETAGFSPTVKSPFLAVSGRAWTWFRY